MKLLAIGAHPDDIEFGCGGTLLKFSRDGENEINLLVMTRGDKGGDPDVRKGEQERSAGIMKARTVFWGGYSDTQVPHSSETIQKVEGIVKEIKPDLIFILWPDDVHQDHHNIAHAAVTATRYSRNVLFYEVPTTQNFQPNVFVDIGDVLEEKFRILEAHASQVFATRIADLSILESAKSSATFRGYQGRVKYAEGFMSLRLSLLYHEGR